MTHNTPEWIQSLLVPAEKLWRSANPSAIQQGRQQTEAEMPRIIGQSRAVQALETGLEIRKPTYHIYVAGIEGTGRHSYVEARCKALAMQMPTPSDQVLVYNFDQPLAPQRIPLPAGEGRYFAMAMEHFLEAAGGRLQEAFEHEAFARQRSQLVSEFQEQEQQLWQQAQQQAEAVGFRVIQREDGIATVPLDKAGQPYQEEAYEQLSQEERETLEARGRQLREQLRDLFQRYRDLQRDMQKRLEELRQRAAGEVIQELLAPIREHFRQHQAVVSYLDRVQKDAVENSADFVPAEDEEHWWQAWERMRRQRELSRFRVNPFVTHEPGEGAPVLFEENPTFYNLFGRQAYRGDFGRMETDLTLLEAGALQRADGGFLILPADALFASPGAWEGLRRFLQTGRVSIENLGEQYGALPTIALHPQPLSVDVKLILIGSGWLYRYLWYNDEVFRKAFGIRADFETEIDRTTEHEAQIAGYLEHVAHKEALLPVEDSAVAAIIEQLSRWASDQRKLSARLLSARQLLIEASAVAQQRQTTGEERFVTDKDVEEALARIRYRQDALETRMDEMFRDGSYLIDVDGQVIGQINGLSVLEDAGYAFGRPNRITARSYVGERGIVNIEREIELSGPIHSKGVGILQGYMTGTYGHDFPLIFGASLCFEQMYDEIDGDSASCAELCALLSSLAGIGLDQGIAVTGSVNQLGQVQPIGAVNEKIEGFFRVCEIRGLTGRQGVVIPATNLASLMLNRQVCEAVKDDRFHIWAVSHIDEILTVLTGVPAGNKESDGKFTPGSVHARVYDRLRQISQSARMDGREAERLRRHRSTSTPLQRFHRF